jgi:hypothetical protein
MQIDAQTLKNWQDLRKYGDAKEIAVMAGVSTETVYLAFRTGKASDHLFKVMTAFYAVRDKYYDSLTQTLNDFQ